MNKIGLMRNFISQNKCLISFVFIMMSNLLVICQSYAFNKKDTIKVQSEKYKLHHYYDWTKTTITSRIEMMRDTNSIFDKRYSFSSLILINKLGDTIFHKSSPALTFLAFSEDENYIIGLSYIKATNPYNIVVLNTLGDILIQRHISDIEVKIDNKQFQHFKLHYPNAFNELEKRNRIHRFQDYWYLDVLIYGMREKYPDALSFISQEGQIIGNHLTTARLSTRLDIEFYLKDEPISHIEINEGKFVWIKLNGINNNEFKLYPCSR